MMGMVPYPYQLKLWKLLNKNKSVIINKSRQIGISFSVAIYIYLKALFEHKKIIIISPSFRQSIHFMDYVATFHRQAKDVISFNQTTDTKTEIKFVEGGHIISVPNNPDTIRGFPADVIVIDEFAHFKNDKEVLSAILPSMSRGGNIIYISTPLGQVGAFHDKWNNAKREGLLNIKLPFTVCKDLKVQDIKKQLDSLTFEQQYNCKFVGDQDSFFPYAIIQKGVNNDLEYVNEYNGKNRVFGFTDIGRSKHFTAIVFIEEINREKYKLLYLELLKNKEFREQKARMVQLVNNFNPFKFGVDATGGSMGMVIAEELRDLLPTTRIEPFNYTNQNKQEIYSNLRALFENGFIEMPNDIQMINSLHSVKRIQTNQLVRYDAEESEETGHGDAAVSLGTAIYLSIEQYKNKPSVAIPSTF